MKKISGDLSRQKQNETKLFKGGPKRLRSFIYLTHFTHTQSIYCILGKTSLTAAAEKDYQAFEPWFCFGASKSDTTVIKIHTNISKDYLK